jgi:hypothetical protein
MEACGERQPMKSNSLRFGVAGCELWKASDHSEQTITKAYRSGKIVKAIKRKPSSN